MYSKKLIILIFSTVINLTVFSQVTSYNFDPDKVNKELSQTMDSLYQEDQKYRLDWMKLRKEGASKERLDSVKNIVRLKDSSNVVFATQLIDKNGWLGPQKIGVQGTQALFLIIQHANLATQKKYYPIIQQAEKEGNILSSNVAIMEDRIAVREGREQTYGSQGYYDAEKKKTYIYPLSDLENLDKLRKSRGLEPMQEYIKDWNVNDYMSYLPYAKELLKKLKEAN